MALAFDQREGYIWLDGEFIDWQDAKIHILSHALHYGSAVFEGIRAYEGQIFKLQEHNERLANSAKLLDFTLPYDTQTINQACIDSLTRNNLSDAYIRPIAWRGPEAMGISAQATKVHLSIASWQWGDYFDHKAEGISMMTTKWRRPSTENAPVKSKASGLYMICTMAKHETERLGFDDALMLDYRGYVTEATGANIFFLIDGKLLTPIVDCVLDGITRRTAIALAEKRGIEVVETRIMPEDISKATEVFLTGTAAEITPVKQIDEIKFTPSTVCQQMMQDYDDLVRGKISL